jgi:WD40 repeat protein
MPLPELVLQIGHDNEIYSVAFSPDSRMLAAGGSERSIKLWDAVTGELLGLLPEGETCHSLTFSPDGALLACAGEGKVNLWETRTGKPQGKLPGHCGIVSSVAYSPDGRLLACASEGRWFGHEVMWVKGGEVQIWDMFTLKLKQTLGKSRAEKLALVCSPDGQILAVASGDNVVRLWDLSTGETRRSVLRQKELRTVAFSPDGQTLATGGEDGARLWNVETMKVRHRFPNEQVTSVAFAPAGDKLAVATTSSVLLYDTVNFKRVAIFEQAPSISGVSNVAFSPDGRTLARGSNPFLRAGSIKFWDVATKKLKRVIPGNDISAVSSVAFSPDGDRLFSAGGCYEQAGNVTLWDIRTGALKELLMEDKDDISPLILSTDGQVIAAQVRGKLFSWGTDSGRQRSKRPLDVTEAFALSPQGEMIAVVDKEAGIRLMELMTGKIRRTIRRQANVLAFSPTGQLLAAGSERGLSIWDIGTGDLQWEGAQPKLDVNQLAFSPDGRFLAIHAIRWKGATGKEEVQVWETKSGDLVHVIGVKDMPFSVLFSPDCSTLAVTAAPDQEAESGAAVQLWDLRSWRLLHRLVCSSEDIDEPSLSFSPDGKLLATTDSKKAVTLWDAKRGKRLHTLEDTSGQVTCVRFSPSGKKLATGNRDGWICLWEVATGKRLLTLQPLPAHKQLRGKKDWIAFTPQGYHNASSGADRFIRWREGDRLLPAKSRARKFRRPDLVAKSLRVK